MKHYTLNQFAGQNLMCHNVLVTVCLVLWWADVNTASKLVPVWSICFQTRECHCIWIVQLDSTSTSCSLTHPANIATSTHSPEWNNGCSLPCSQTLSFGPVGTQTSLPVTLLCSCSTCRVCVSIWLSRSCVWKIQQSGLNESWDGVQWTCTDKLHPSKIISGIFSFCCYIYTVGSDASCCINYLT